MLRFAWSFVSLFINIRAIDFVAETSFRKFLKPSMTTLLLSARYTADDQALWRAAIGRGWPVVRARGLQVPHIEDAEIVFYVEPLFALPIAQMLGRQLLDPPEDWLEKIPMEFRKRLIYLTTLNEARGLNSPRFTKPPNDKSFLARVYDSGSELPTDFDDQTPVLIAEPVDWETEYRCFCLDANVSTLSPYLRSGVLAAETGYAATDSELVEAKEFTEAVLRDGRNTTPRAIVIDVGRIRGRGFAVVEANGAWGTGIYGCDPNLVLDVIRHATIQLNPS